MVIETNIDDMTGEICGYVMEKLFDEGALDVFYSPIYMKKNRPAIKLTVICSKDKIDMIQNILFKETSTIGIRKYITQRECMNREIIDVSTPYGIIRVKVSSLNDIEKYAPEYEDCKSIADRHGIPLKDIYDIISAKMHKN